MNENNKRDKRFDKAGGAKGATPEMAQLAASMWFEEIGAAIELNLGGPGKRIASRQNKGAVSRPVTQKFVTLDGHEITSNLETIKEHVIRFDYPEGEGGPLRVSIFENGRAAGRGTAPPAMMLIRWGEDPNGQAVETTEFHVLVGGGSKGAYNTDPEATRTVTHLSDGLLCFGMRASGVEQAVTIAPDGVGRSVELRFSQSQILQFGSERIAACAMRIELDEKEKISRLMVKDQPDGSDWSPPNDRAFHEAMQEAARQTLQQLRQYHGYPEPLIEQDQPRSTPLLQVGLEITLAESGEDPWLHALDILNSPIESRQPEVAPKTEAEPRQELKPEKEAAPQRELEADLEQALSHFSQYGQRQLREAFERMQAGGLNGCAAFLIGQFIEIDPYDALYNLNSSSRVLPRLVEAGVPANGINEITTESLHALRAELASLPEEAFAALCDAIHSLDLPQHPEEARLFGGRLKNPQFSRLLTNLAMGRGASLPGPDEISISLRSLLADDPALSAQAGGLNAQG